MSLVITPEMSGQVIDESHFDFHVTCKAKVANAINKMKSGVDLLKTLSHLNLTTDKRWTQNTCKDPSVTALLDILEEYKRVEKRPSRAKMIVPLIEYAIGLYASDLFFKERGAWFLHQIIVRQEAFQICHIQCFADPDQWYPMTRNNPASENTTGQGTGGNFYKLENDTENPPDIIDEYKKWYGIDITKDNIEITPEMREKAIAEGNAKIMEG